MTDTVDFVHTKLQLIDSLLTVAQEQDRGTWEIVAFGEEKEHFGDAFACFDNSFLRLRFVRERGDEFLDLGPSCGSDSPDESLLFPFEIAYAAIRGPHALKDFMDEISRRWKQDPAQWHVVRANELQTLELINEHWNDFVRLFQEESLVRPQQVRKAAEDQIESILQTRSKDRGPHNLHTALSGVLKQLTDDEYGQIVDLVDEASRKKLESIRRDSSKGSRTVG